MALERILETEVMDTLQEAIDYDALDHHEVNRAFVDDLLAALAGSKFMVQGSRSSEATLNLEPGTLNSADSAMPLDIIDLGTGTAQIPIELCRRYARCRVMACDAAAHMLEQARYNLAAVDFNDRIELLAELHGESDDADGHELVVNVGTRATLSEHCTLLASLGTDVDNTSGPRNRVVSYLGLQLSL